MTRRPDPERLVHRDPGPRDARLARRQARRQAMADRVAGERQYPTMDELRPFLGDRWAVCRATPANLARYGRCITPGQYRAAQEQALAARTVTPPRKP